MADFQYKFQVYASSMNSKLEVTNKTIFEWMEDAASLHSDLNGCGMKNLETNGYSWVVIQWKVKVIRRVKYGETVTVNTWVSGRKKLYTFREFEFFDEEGNVVAIASSKWVLTHLEQGMISVPDDIIDGYGENMRTVFEEGNSMPRLKDPMDFSMPYEFKVPCTFIDVNDHVNNIFYLDIAYQAMPLEVFKNNRFDEIEIMYRKECKLNDKLMCYYHFDGTHHVVSIRDEDSKQLHVLVKLR